MKKGFTLIELLIVITLLGILAVAVLSAINPIEQINRSKDTAREGDCEQLINAIDRFYANKGYYPWMVDAASSAPLSWVSVGDTGPSGFVDGDGDSVLEKLSGETGEIKSSFVTRVQALRPSLQAYNRGTQGDSTYVCFKPSSASFREKAWGRCTETAEYGALPNDYPADACPDAGCVGEASASTATECYYCLP